jgi:galactokinase
MTNVLYGILDVVNTNNVQLNTRLEKNTALNILLADKNVDEQLELGLKHANAIKELTDAQVAEQNVAQFEEVTLLSVTQAAAFVILVAAQAAELASLVATQAAMLAVHTAEQNAEQVREQANEYIASIVGSDVKQMKLMREVNESLLKLTAEKVAALAKLTAEKVAALAKLTAEKVAALAKVEEALVEAKKEIESVYLENKRLTLVTNRRVESLAILRKNKKV